MTETRYTLSEIYSMLGQTDTGRIRLKMTLATSHTERVEAVEEAIDWIGLEFTKTRQERHDQGEDALTIELVTALKAMGFEASHDMQYGGHCDIVIEARNGFLWLGECKIHKDYDWLLKGFNQLDTRYSTGMPGQDSGELVIYCPNKRMDQVMARWVEHLRAGRPEVTIAYNAGDLSFRTTHVHEGTGANFNVRHKGISIYFNPQDKR